jgi:hypothetical protein
MPKEAVMKSLKLAGVLSLAVGLGSGALAHAHDELYYSAAACVPYKATNWNGNGAAGFEFTNVGTWANYDNNETQILICPVPYARNVSNLAPIVAKVVIDDFNEDVFARAYLCGRNSTSGAQQCVSDDNFPTIWGTSTIELTLTPASTTRFVWIEVHIPADAEDDNPFSPAATSHLVGYRIERN